MDTLFILMTVTSYTFSGGDYQPGGRGSGSTGVQYSHEVSKTDCEKMAKFANAHSGVDAICVVSTTATNKKPSNKR